MCVCVCVGGSLRCTPVKMGTKTGDITRMCKQPSPWEGRGGGAGEWG